ncbi:MAG: hypothetical protein QOG65_591 [Actinomycetota bacterium]|jgi:AmiR/NasT family two-component response regulator|nr:hypothetical protein [Actinomycetota bacterium]
MAGNSQDARADHNECLRRAIAIVSTRLGCPVEDALDRLRLWARATGRSVDEIAADVIEHVISIDS